MKANYTLLLSLVLFAFGCKKDKQEVKDSNIETVPMEQFSGTVILPDGNNINLNNCFVESPVGSAQITKESYSVNTYTQNANTLFVLDNMDNVVLMGYKMPGVQSYIIDVRTTAVALVMNTPIMLSVPTDKRMSVINVIINHPDFDRLTSEIEQRVLSSKSILDESDMNVIKYVYSIVESVAQKTTQDYYSPVDFVNSGRDFTFFSGKNIFTTVVGVYRNAEKIDDVVVGGEKVIPTSFEDIQTGKGTIASNGLGKSTKYRIEGDGQIDLIIRTGWPTADDGTPEHKSAELKNLLSLTAYLLNGFLPFINAENATCLENMVLKIVKAIGSTNIVSNPSGFFKDVFEEINSAQNIESIKKCYSTKEINGKFYKKLAKYYNLLDRGSSLFGGAVNITFYLAQWSLTNPAYDTCFIISEDKIINTHSVYSGTVQYGDWKQFQFKAPTPYSGYLRVENLVFYFSNNINYPNPSRSATYSYSMGSSGIPNFTSWAAGEEATSISVSNGIIDIQFPNAVFRGETTSEGISGTFNSNGIYIDRPSGDTTKPISFSTPILLKKVK